MAHDEAEKSDIQINDPIWLDCTLRDGGYHNNWEFPDAIVNRYLHAMQAAGADRVEVGFRTLLRRGYSGPTAFTSDSFLSSLAIPSKLRLGVMVNASELSGGPEELRDKLHLLFPETSKSWVHFVRVAAHISELPDAVAATKWLSQEGYEVGLNIMQISEANDDFLRQVGKEIPVDSVDVLYVADSLGTLNPSQTSHILSTIRRGWRGAMGIHAHDNGGLALANSLAGLESGASWVDSTVLGMGRGAGNTRSELLLGHLSQHQGNTADVEDMEILISDYFEPLRRRTQWGPSFHYVTAAAKGIHPTFIQQLTSNASYSSAERTTAIAILGASDARKFSEQKLQEATTWVQDFSSPPSNWDQSSLFAGQKVLLVGAGVSVAEHQHALEQFIQQHEPITVATNLGGIIAEELIDAHAACHPLRLVSDADEYANLAKALIAPAQLLPEVARARLTDSGLLRDLGLEAKEAGVAAIAGLISIPEPQVLAYSLLACLSGGAEVVYLAGFDGYAEGDPRRIIEQNLLDHILRLGYPGTLEAITPTSFNVAQSSVHGMIA